MRRRDYFKDMGDLSWMRYYSNLNSIAFLQLVDDVRLAVFTLAAWNLENKQSIDY
jgi:hypothetical protein